MKVIIALALVGLAFGAPTTEDRGVIACSLCKNVVEAFADVIEQDEAAIRQRAETFCERSNFLKPLCLNLLDQYLPRLMQVVGDGATPEIACQQIQVCAQNDVAAQAMERGFGCDLCTQLVGQAQEVAQENEDVIKNTMNQFCERVSFLEDVCKSVVDTYLPQIIEFIENGDTPTTVCRRIRLCSQDEVLKNRGFGCDLCTQLATQAQEVAQENEEVVKNTVNQFCERLTFLEDVCKTVVDTYLTQMIEFIENGETPKNVCKRIRLCSRDEQLMERGLGCTVCKQVVEFAGQYAQLEMPAIQEKLDGFCGRLGFLKGVCQGMISVYLPKIVSDLQNGNNAESICDNINFC